MTQTMQKRDNTVPGYRLEHVVDNIFNNTFRRFFDNNLWDSDSQLNRGTVPVNVRETNTHYEVDVVAPGCRKEDFRIQVQDKNLTISFSQNEQKKEKSEKEGWVRNEYALQSFSRSFTLDDTIDADNINASYKDGILNIVLPKKEEDKKLSKTIDVM